MDRKAKATATVRSVSRERQPPWPTSSKSPALLSSNCCAPLHRAFNLSILRVNPGQMDKREMNGLVDGEMGFIHGGWMDGWTGNWKRLGDDGTCP